MAADDTAKALQSILEIGCEYLGVASGKIARVEEDQFVFESLHGDILNVSKPGDTIAYNKTIAYHLPEGNYTVSIPNLARSHLKEEPCYEISDIESYIGTRTRMLGDKFGVLAFMDSEPREKDFTDMEKTIVRLLAQAVGFIHDRGERVAILKKRQSELENLNEGLNRFTYLASHDLQEPLRKIQQSGELLRDDFGEMLDDDGSYFLKIMTKSADRMRSLIDDLLLYSTSANVDLDKEDISMATLVDLALDDLKPGMDIDDTINIFEPFVRLHAKSEYKGSGIGLAICKSVCDRHGWGLTYKSELEKGTEILIEIPNREIS